MCDHNSETTDRLLCCQRSLINPDFEVVVVWKILPKVSIWTSPHCAFLRIYHKSHWQCIFDITGDSSLFSFPLGQCSFRCRLQNNMCLLATGRFFVVENQRLRACAKWIWCKQNNMQLWSFDHICVTDGSLWLKCKSVIFLNNFKTAGTRLNPQSLWFKSVQAGCKNFEKKGKEENWKHTTSGLRPLKNLRFGDFMPLSGRKRGRNIP